jgi:hypothetical protein
MTADEPTETIPIPKRKGEPNSVKLARATASREKLLILLSRRGRPRRGESPLPPGFGRCAICRCAIPARMLEVDHVDGRQWEVRRVNAWTRVARYWRELRARVRMRALCSNCNGRTGATRRYGRRRW